MESPTMALVLLTALSIMATLSGPTMVQAETTTNMTPGDNQCFPLQRRQDLLDGRLNEVNNRITERDTRLTERDADVNTRLNGLNMRQNEVDARLNRIDSRFDSLETMISDMKEYLVQRLEAMEVKAELTLAGSKHTDVAQTNTTQQQQQQQQVTLADLQPTETSKVPKDCREVYTMGNTTSGVYRIAPEPNTTFDVYCDQELDAGGWTVIQQRKDGNVDFYQNWTAYKDGFGQFTSEFWLGNDKIHLLTKHGDQRLKVELTSPDGQVKYANYGHFSIADEAHKYTLNVTGYTGGTPPGDALRVHNGHAFTTRDKDNDAYIANCAVGFTGAWWYDECYVGGSNLNGLYGDGGKGPRWLTWMNPTPVSAVRLMLKRN